MQICAYCNAEYGQIIREEYCPSCNAPADGNNHFYPMLVEDYVLYIVKNYLYLTITFRFYKGLELIGDVTYNQFEWERIVEENEGIDVIETHVLEALNENWTHLHDTSSKQNNGSSG